MSKSAPSTLKQGYPNLEQMQNIPGAHDMEKWLQAVKTIYYEEKKNQIDRKAAINLVTKGWNVTEINDFINWLRFYEEGTHLKYKVAQFWYGNADVGYLLPIKPDAQKQEPTQVSGQNIDFARDSVADELSSSEKKQIIEKQRNKIIGRLDSAEKLLRSQEGQLFADKEFASLLETIYELKKKIQMVNKKSSSDKLYSDMIVREANRLTHKGFVKAANLLHSLAEDKPTYPPIAPKDPSKPNEPPKPEEQPKPNEPSKPGEPPKPGEPAKDANKPPTGAPSPTPPAPPMQGSGNAGGLPMAPPVPQEPESQAIKSFLTKLEDPISQKTDKNSLDEDELEVIDGEDDLVVEAQVAPPEPPATPAPKSVTEPKEPNTEGPATAIAPSKDFDHMMESIFSNLTISDVVAKFEDIAKFYKTREMPRQLALADMMLDSLGLAPFFPALSEATNKALEANNYISTRLEDIISKLRGTMKTREIDMTDEDKKPKSPEIEQAKKTLQEDADKEKSRKQMRKDLEEESLKNQMKETPDIEIEEDLGGPPPAPPTTPPAPPAKPVA